MVPFGWSGRGIPPRPIIVVSAIEMKYEIVEVAPCQFPTAHKYAEIAKLEIGQGFLVPWTDLSYQSAAPAKGAQQSAYYWGRKLGRRYTTRKNRRGVWIMRTG